jgi:hypothetical protein
MNQVTSKADLLAAIDSSWVALNAGLDRLTEAEMTGVYDPAGWTIKDHLSHLAAWEQSAVYMLAGRPRHEALGIEESLYFSEDFDAMNEAIFQANRGRPLPEARANLRVVHESLLVALARLDETALRQPYSHYLPDEADDDRPAMDVVYVNSAYHFAEHLGWIESLLANRAG